MWARERRCCGTLKCARSLLVGTGAKFGIDVRRAARDFMVDGDIEKLGKVREIER